MNRSDVYEAITDRVIAAIEAGAGEWQMPWHRSGVSRPLNAHTKKPYRGINVVALWAAADGHHFSSGFWGTYKQWGELEAQVRKGERASLTEHGEEPPDDVGAELDRLAEEIASIQRRSEAYSPEELSRAGAIIALSSEGALRIERGFIKPEDAVQQAPSDGAEAPGDGQPTSPVPTGNTTMPNGTEPENGKPLSNQLTERLTAERTVALQECVAAKPEAALMVVVHALALRVFYRQEFRGDSCLGLEAKVAEPGTFAPSVGGSRAGQSLARRHEDWSRKLPTGSAEIWNWVIGQDTETLLALLAYCAARTIDAVQRSWERNSRGSRHAGELALTVGLDMAEWWAPTRESYFAHVSKAFILEAVSEGVSEKDADTLTGLKKDPMIEHAERLLSGRRWLPAVLRNGNASAPASASA